MKRKTINPLEFYEMIRVHEELSKSGHDVPPLDFSNANIWDVDIVDCNLENANFSNSEIHLAKFSDTILRGANFENSIFYECSFKDTDLSDAKGWQSPIDFLESHFEKYGDGYISYKQFDLLFEHPDYWKIEEGSILRENVDRDASNSIGCGINAGTLSYVHRAERLLSAPNVIQDKPIWKLHIRGEWLPSVVIPYDSYGNIRCERVQLLGIVDDIDAEIERLKTLGLYAKGEETWERFRSI